MGYDLHITRRRFWSDSGDDIEFNEFCAYIRSDEEFTYPGQLGDDSADWRSPSTGYESWLTWSDGQAYTKNPDPEFIDKLVKVAKALRANAQGDDGERYPSATPVQTGEEPSTSVQIPTRLPETFLQWPLWKQLIAAFLLGCLFLALRILVFGE